ncbi:hypothetical protein M9Y10_001145 [Tritrichomonas musculus]|uniref:Uncharacterized protein n=1 Tax=Tritrichomonas musculus TaxID=1915356 RepID=A0ABR2L6A2_9EUKA
MSENLDHPWQLLVNEYVKETDTPIVKFSTDSPLMSLPEIYQKLEEIRVTNLPFFSDVSLTRADIPHDDQHQVTRISIVNFPSEMSTQVFIELIDAIFNKLLVFESEIENIIFSRRMQNYSVLFELTGFNNLINPSILTKIDEHLSKYREPPNDNQFCVEIYPIPRTQYQNGRKKLSAKNTADSVRNLIRKRQSPTE